MNLVSNNWDSRCWHDKFERARVDKDLNLVHELMDELVAVYGSMCDGKSNKNATREPARFDS
jgi:hypothetical protein